MIYRIFLMLTLINIMTMHDVGLLPVVKLFNAVSFHLALKFPLAVIPPPPPLFGTILFLFHYCSHLLQVNKAQTAQKGLDSSRNKDAKGKLLCYSCKNVT